MVNNRPKSLDAPIVRQMICLEAKAYLRCDQWRAKYRYTLINEFRQSITRAKNEVITAFELHGKFREEKLYHYSLAQSALTITESNMDIMIMNDFGVISEKEWAEFAAMIYDIRGGLSRLVKSLAKSAGGSESPELAMGSASASYKDA